MDKQKNNETYPQIHAMEIWIADLPRQSEGGPCGHRPVVIFSIDQVGERTPFAPVIPLTTVLSFAERNYHASLHTNCLRAESGALCEHMTLVHRSRLVRCIGQVDDLQEQIAIYVALGHQLDLLPAAERPVRSRCGRKSILPDSTLNVLRRWKDMTRRQLSAATGITARDIEYFEKGRRSMAMDDVLRLARYFQVSATCLLNNDFTELERMGVER